MISPGATGKATPRCPPRCAKGARGAALGAGPGVDFGPGGRGRLHHLVNVRLGTSPGAGARQRVGTVLKATLGLGLPQGGRPDT